MIYQLIIWLSDIYISVYDSIFCRTYLLMFVKYLTAQIFITEKTLLLFQKKKKKNSCNFVEIEKCLLFQCHLAFTTVPCAAHSMNFS